MAYARNTLSFVQTLNALPFSSSLFLQAGGMANNFTSALKLINWVVTAVSHLWNLLTLEARKQWSATAHVCLVGVRASALSCPLLVRSVCCQWLQDRLIKRLNHLGWHCCLGFFQWPTEYSGFCRPGKSVLAQEMCIIANTMKNYKRGKSRRCEVFFPSSSTAKQ